MLRHPAGRSDHATGEEVPPRVQANLGARRPRHKPPRAPGVSNADLTPPK